MIKTPRRTVVKALPVEPMFDTVNSSNATGGSKRALPYPLFKTLPFLTRDIPSPVKSHKTDKIGVIIMIKILWDFKIMFK